MQTLHTNQPVSASFSRIFMIFIKSLKSSETVWKKDDPTIVAILKKVSESNSENLLRRSIIWSAVIIGRTYWHTLAICPLSYDSSRMNHSTDQLTGRALIIGLLHHRCYTICFINTVYCLISQTLLTLATVQLLEILRNSQKFSEILIFLKVFSLA